MSSWKLEEMVAKGVLFPTPSMCMRPGRRLRFPSLVKSDYGRTLLLPSQERSTKLLVSPVVVVSSWICLPEQFDRVLLVSVGVLCFGYFAGSLVKPPH